MNDKKFSKFGFHVLRCNDELNMSNNFIFVDTETKRINGEEKFYLGWLLNWNRKTDIKEYVFLKEKKDFYTYVLNHMNNIFCYKEKIKPINNLIIYAHNTDFDIKVLGGLKPFIKDGFSIESFYCKGTRFILRLKKENKIISIYDTMNYIPMSLKNIGDSIGLKKMDIDFNICSYDELSIYCKNDVEIIYLFIYKLIEFLVKYNLSKLMPTVASLSMNIFRHKFYNKKINPIYIHNWIKAIELEKMSYKGGICDCFKVGKFENIELNKLDINSMYPYVMKKFEYPTKLLFYGEKEQFKNNKLQLLFDKYFDSKLIIANVKIFLPKEYAYILVKSKINKEDKSIFLSGEFDTDLTTPELKFVLQYGKILEIKKMAIYEKGIIFNDFVDFFYEQRKKFSSENNDAYKLFCKYILNSLYGKFGQNTIEYIESENKGNYEFESNIYIDSDTKEHRKTIKMGNKIFEVKEKEKKSFDSFIAIPSFVTAYARMYLIEMVLKANRKNVYYIDTDCLIVNKEGNDLLKELIDNKELGKLKLEETSINTEIFRPKYYIFNKIKKCKGVKKNHIIINENDKEMIIEQEQFIRFNTSLRKNEFDRQKVIKIIKHMNKHYDKGIILQNGDIEPYNINKI